MQLLLAFINNLKLKVYLKLLIYNYYNSCRVKHISPLFRYSKRREIMLA